MKKILLALIILILLTSSAIAEDGIRFLVNPNETLILQDKKETSLVALVEDDASKCRYLRILLQDGSVVSSQSLPDGITLDDFHSGSNNVLLRTVNGEPEMYISIQMANDGQWICENVQLWNGKSFAIGKESLTDLNSDLINPGRNDAITYGKWQVTIPTGQNLQAADFSMLPMSYDEAFAQLDTDAYAYVNNPNPSDRLHLRAKADKDAPSLGKFYNRTPVQVLEKGEIWSFVQIGSDENHLTGYMMTKYLAFGNENADVHCAFPQLSPLESYFGAEFGPAIYAQPYQSSKTIGHLYVSENNFIIGISGEEWLIVMTPEGLVGYCKVSDFGEGNG